MNARWHRTGSLLLAAALTACSGDRPTTPPDPLVIRRLPEPVHVEAAQVVEGNNAFALDLYRQLRSEPGNLFLSPFSISTAFAMTYAGARGATEREMSEVLHFPLDQERLHPVFHELLNSLNTGVGLEGYRLDVANRLWGQTGFGFLPAYLTLTRDLYEAGLETVDFLRETEVARTRINAWVEEKTQQKIKNLIPMGVLSPATVLVLTNAIYFKGQWQSQFDSRLTRDDLFHVSAARTVTVPLMHRKAEVGTARAPGVELLELPYRGRDLSMLILLPEAMDGLPALEESLTPANLALWRGLLHSEELDVYLPRFTVTSFFSLKETLARMGMSTAFSAAADFSGMNGERNLFIQDALHKAFVNVNEEGTEAAAATAVIVGRTSVPGQFRADHPFLFLIRDNVTESILFLGRVVDPTAGR